MHGDKGGVQLLLKVPELLYGQIMLLIAQLCHAEVGNGIVQPLGIGVLPVHFQHLKALDIHLGGFNIPGVGKIAAAGGGDDGNALGNVKLRAVMAAVAGGQQQAVGFLTQQGQVLVNVFHIRFSFFSRRK